MSNTVKVSTFVDQVTRLHVCLKVSNSEHVAIHNVSGVVGFDPNSLWKLAREPERVCRSFCSCLFHPTSALAALWESNLRGGINVPTQYSNVLPMFPCTHLVDPCLAAETQHLKGLILAGARYLKQVSGPCTSRLCQDFRLDGEVLLPFDLKASAAHATMLQKIGVLTKEVAVFAWGRPRQLWLGFCFWIL